MKTSIPTPHAVLESATKAASACPVGRAVGAVGRAISAGLKPYAGSHNAPDPAPRTGVEGHRAHMASRGTPPPTRR